MQASSALLTRRLSPHTAPEAAHRRAAALCRPPSAIDKLTVHQWPSTGPPQAARRPLTTGTAIAEARAAGGRGGRGAGGRGRGGGGRGSSGGAGRGRGVREDTEGQRLSKVMAEAGVASRRACEELIISGVVKVNNEVVRVPQTRVMRRKDKVGALVAVAAPQFEAQVITITNYLWYPYTIMLMFVLGPCVILNMFYNDTICHSECMDL